MSSRSHPVPLSVSLHRLARTFRQLSVRIGKAAALSRSRRQLNRLDDHLLRDIGLSRGEAMSEATRSAWDAPSHWHV